MFRTIQDFLDSWRYERIATLKNLKCLTDASLSQKITPDSRSLGFLAWHLVISIVEMGSKSGLKIPGPPEDSPVPKNASEIVSAYDQASETLSAEVKSKWTDAMLLNEIDMYGQKWTIGATLTSIIYHQTHHRGQMTVLMRQAGLKVHGVYGPSKEEWAHIGMSAPE
jgi:uncharacterized damage-inducible protein DinB